MSKNDFKRLDAEFENLILDVISDIDGNLFTPKKRSERRELADDDDFQFCQIYYPKIFDSPFNDLHRHISALESGNYTVSGFRKGGKTAFTFITKIVKPIVQNKKGIYNIALRTQDIAKERTFHIYRLITMNRLLMYDYGVQVIQELKGYYILNNCTLVATSVETGLRNFIDDEFNRFRVSVNDDLYNKGSVTSERDNEKVTDFITSEVYGQMEDDGLSITLGNSINEDCPIVRLKKMFPKNHYSLPALDANGRSNWRERYGESYWEAKQEEIPYDVWMGEYQDTPMTLGEVFDRDWIRHVNLNLIEILASISAADPAHGTSPAGS